MRPRRLSLDTKKLEQPQDCYTYGKNGIWNANIGAEENENGFLVSGISVPYKTIGIIETDTFPVYFSTDNVNSAFGFHDVNQDIYVPIFDDSVLSFKLNFNINRPIKGEYRRNFRNEIELVWLELASAGANPPRWANTSRIGANLNDFLLFPKSLIPTITPTIQPGGNLGMGAYYFALNYISNDGTITSYTTLTSPLIAVSDDYSTIPGANTGKAITLTIAGIDQTYDRIGLVVVEVINGVTTPYTLPELPIAPNVTFIYTGAEKQTQLTLDEVIIPAAYYENAYAITQMDDQLFLANMTEETIIDWQQYANLVKVQWKSELTNVSSRPNIPVESGEQRGWMHEEVAAFYMVLKLRSGRNSRAFTVIGPVPQSGDLVQSSIATAQGLTAAVYQIEDTVRNIDPVAMTGDCGIWINQNETYPDIIQFDSSAIGGENLRGQPVRHHRMPSIRFCKENLYGSVADYGRTSLDTLGLIVSNVIIPADLQDQVIGWELHYAQKDYNNAQVLGQSLLMFGAQANSDAAAGGNITSTGGNWGSYQRTHSSGAATDGESLKPVNNYFRFHAFDMLFNRPSINPTHLSLHLYYVIRFGPGLNVALSNANEVIFDLDYTNGQGNVDVPKVPVAGNQIYKVTEGQYIPNNGSSGDFSNIRLEDAYVAKISAPGSDLFNSMGWSWMRRDYDKGNNQQPLFENTYLTNLMTIRNNVYLNYFSQTLVRTGVVFPSTVQASTTTIYGGDTFLSEYTFVTYGLVTKKDIVTNTGITDWKTADTDGIKTNHRFICETASDGAARYQIPGNSYSAFWPQSSMSGGTSSFLYNFSRSNSPNQIGYSRDCNAVGSLLNGIVIASPYDEFVSISPTKIVRSIKQVSESVINSWKNFNALDYYEATKNKGPIINLCGMNDRIIIHHRDGLFITRSKATFDTDITQVTLGTGDIFQFQPNEVRPAHLGYGGTANPLACMLTPVGYLYPDNITGELFLFDGTTIQNIGVGLINFFLKYLTISEINNYIGNGIIVGYEQFYKRILLTVKNVQLASNVNFVPGYVETPEFFATLVPNQSVVYKDGRYQLFKGVNSSEYECNSTQFPELESTAFSSNELVPNGTVIGTITATGGTQPYSYIITSSNNGGVGIDPLTGQLTVINSNAFVYTESVLVLNVQVTDAVGNIATSTTSITINKVSSTPVLPPYSVSLPEHSANGTAVNTEVATDRDGKAITYSITGGNTLGAFVIDATTGIVTVADTTQLDYFTNPTFVLTVRATTPLTGAFAENALNVSLTYVHQPPTVTNDTYTISTAANNGDLVGTLTPATQRAGQTGILVYSKVSDSTPAGAFAVDLDPESTTFLEVTVLDKTKLIVGDNPYVITLQAVDPVYPSDSSNFTATITVFAPYQSVEKSGLFIKTCISGQTGTTVNYVVVAGTYMSNISQADADAQAQADVTANGQAYANSHGTCLINSTVGTLTVDYFSDTSVDLCMFVSTAGTSELNQIAASTANGGPLQLPNDGTPVATCWMLSSDKLAGPPVRRFAINIAYFINKYPLIDTHTFSMVGRAASSGVSSGVYALRNIPRGVMVMEIFSAGPPILYIPSVTDPTTDEIVSWNSHTVAGADGTVGTGVGSAILLFTYVVSTNTLTITTY